MTSIIIFLGVLVLGYISTTFVFGKIQSRFYMPSGVEYIFLGIILGPSFANWFTETFSIPFPAFIDGEILSQLNPGITTAIGLVGFIYGLKFKFRNFSEVKPEHWRLALTEILLSFLLIGGIAFGLTYYFYYDGSNLSSIIAAASALGVIGSLSSNYIIKALIKKYDSGGAISKTLFNASLINVNLLIFLYGFLFASIHVGAREGVKFTPIEWIVVSLVLTLLIGFLFFIFLGRETDSNKFFVAVLGIVLFTSGVAYFVNFSPLYMNFVLGAIVANLSKISERIEESIERLFHPLSVLIVVMVGFYWVPVANLTLFLGASAIFVVVRYSAKMLAGWFSYTTAFEKEHLTPNIGKGLLPFDIVACAMVLDYINVYKNSFTPLVMSAVLSSVIIYGIFSYSSAKNIFIDAGEIGEEK